MRRTIVALAIVCGLGASACGTDENLLRVIDGDVTVSRFVPAEAYAAFLAGMLAESDGRLGVAAGRYRDAIAIDDQDPLVWARLGNVLCKMSPSAHDADDAFAHALSLDPSFSTAQEARAECAERRKNGAEAAIAMTAAAADDPRRPELDARASALTDRTGGSARERILAATRVFDERPEAWEALLAWSVEHHDAFLASRGCARIAALRARPSSSCARSAIALAGFGAIADARVVARHTVMVGGGTTTDPLVARLAVDAALESGEIGAVEALSARGHVPLGEAAARASLLGKFDLARTLAQEVAAADPNEPNAAAILALSARADKKAEHTESGSPHGDLAAATWVLVTRAILATAGPDVARAFAKRAAHAEIDGRDALVVDAAVDLAAAGVIDPQTDSERVELAVRKGEAPRLLPALDERHELLARMLGDQTGPDPRTERLHAELAPWVGIDPLVTYATVESARRRGAVSPALREALVRVPAHPLTLALRVALASDTDKADEQKKLRAVARTPFETKLSGM